VVGQQGANPGNKSPHMQNSPNLSPSMSKHDIIKTEAKPYGKGALKNQEEVKKAKPPVAHDSLLHNQFIN
jgi:hypothetical protein